MVIGLVNFYFEATGHQQAKVWLLLSYNDLINILEVMCQLSLAMNYLFVGVI